MSLRAPNPRLFWKYRRKEQHSLGKSVFRERGQYVVEHRSMMRTSLANLDASVPRKLGRKEEESLEKGKTP